jgi:hypothetical protein
MPVERPEVLEIVGQVERRVMGLIHQLQGPGRWAVVEVTATWSGGVVAAGTMAHGLDFTPTRAVAASFPGPQGDVIVAHCYAIDATDVSVQAAYRNGFTPAAGATVPVDVLLVA